MKRLITPNDSDYATIQYGSGVFLRADGWFCDRVGCKKKPRRLFGHVCQCGKLFLGPIVATFCSRHCLGVFRHSERIAKYAKSVEVRKLTSERNRTEANRAKVRAALRRRKIALGNDYHSAASKAKIGAATQARWDSLKDKLLPVLIWNGSQRKKEGFPYGTAWRRFTERFRIVFPKCVRCGANATDTHHIIPARFGGEAGFGNALALCRRCHRRMDTLGLQLFAVVRDWEVVRLIVRHEFTDGIYLSALSGRIRKVRERQIHSHQ